MGVDFKRNADGSLFIDERGRKVLEFIRDPPEPDPRWDDQTCVLCGKTENWFRCLKVGEDAFCAECLPPWGRRLFSQDVLGGGEDIRVLELLVRALFQEAHAVKLRARW